jgi:hypothetical protein
MPPEETAFESESAEAQRIADRHRYQLLSRHLPIEAAQPPTLR